jgi:hypothetical protein
MTDHDSDENRTQVNPDEFETFDQYDPNLDPPEVPDDLDEDPPEFRAEVPPLSVEAAVATLAAAYNRR